VAAPFSGVVSLKVEVGSAVTSCAVGDRVGVSTYVDSCRECARCVEGLPQYCIKGEVLTYNDHHYDGRPTYGGFRTSMSVDEGYVVPIPEAVPSEIAGPLMCAGTTVWSPLRAWSAGQGTRVGVVGLGGLGHLAVLLAASLGAEVSVLSRSRAKEADATRLGATRLVTLDEAASTGLDLDLVINTVGDLPHVGELLAVLAQDGTWVDVGVPTSPREIRWDQLAAGRRRLTASKIGSLDDMRTLLEHAAATGVRPDVTVIGADRVGEAFDALAAGAAAYRFVLDVTTLTEGPR
jgi:uncharacterized zinc-type alcohol dehydrogenase-like protein